MGSCFHVRAGLSLHFKSARLLLFWALPLASQLSPVALLQDELVSVKTIPIQQRQNKIAMCKGDAIYCRMRLFITSGEEITAQK